ncbi:uncharacterized protein F4822DRAFT_338657 [Hypoxylon trugodes]|uniref:uncharacterized protein n=1 Tax=Hypoxylon trugodes TaxID=326681 RepID=UPI00219674C5|nr:uncharacterized protein F4822DRAFT_338657 [Hypoxylon trugodes]KAI1385249.1 hypothetical protein F4822DRAFT_338657 [Hypoxylon trugodes]
MDASAKRKHARGSDNRPVKRSKGGSNGRWQTPHQKSKLESLKGKGIEPGDVGIWTTCVKGKERQSLEELLNICEEYGEKLYAIKREDPDEAAEDDEEEDIESSIKKEVQGMKPKEKPKDSVFEPLRMDLDCLLFMRTKAPINSVEMVRQICKDAKGVEEKKERKSRFINRFTPVTASGKATQLGLEEVAKKVLGEHFQLAGDEDDQAAAQTDAYTVRHSLKSNPEYAIRPTFRAHNILKRDDVIKKVADLISSHHKVNLSSPDKVILIDIYQTFCGMSVVDGDWEDLKRYNLHEIYMAASKAQSESNEKPKEKENA